MTFIPSAWPGAKNNWIPGPDGTFCDDPSVADFFNQLEDVIGLLGAYNFGQSSGVILAETVITTDNSYTMPSGVFTAAALTADSDGSLLTFGPIVYPENGKIKLHTEPYVSLPAQPEADCFLAFLNHADGSLKSRQYIVAHIEQGTGTQMWEGHSPYTDVITGTPGDSITLDVAGLTSQSGIVSSILIGSNAGPLILTASSTV